MKDNVLETVLTEILEELKEIKIEQSLNNKAVETYTQTINQFESKLNNLKVNVPEFNNEPIINIQKQYINFLKKSNEEHINSINSEICKSLYTEGKRLKLINSWGKHAITLFFSCLLLYCIIALSLNYFHKNSENERFKYAYYFMYQNSKEKDKKILKNLINEFQNDSLFEIHKSEIRLIFDDKNN